MKIFKSKLNKRIYLDYAASAPVDNVVSKKIAQVNNIFANSSAIHSNGIEAKVLIEESRKKIADTLFAHSDEIIFTGSGTESDVLAIIGVVRTYKGLGKPHIITTEIEHSAVLLNCKMLEKNGDAEVTYLSINGQGVINPKDVRDALKENTVLVSVMYANNEIGTIQPITEIAKVIRHFRKLRKEEKEINFENSSDLLASEARHFQNQLLFPLFHTDACQAMNYLPTENIEKLGVDLLSFNSSKIYGPKGVGVLYKKRGINIIPLYTGGGQEFGLRSGTENLSSIVGMASALEQANKIKYKECDRLIKIRDYGIEKLLEVSKNSGYKIILNGDKENRLPNNINISISDISSELLVIELDAKGIAVSSKSACKSDEPDESYVITALRKAQNIPMNTVDGSLRISIGRQTKKSDIDTLITALSQILKKYKELNDF